MKKLGNKFIIIVILLMCCIIGSQVYIAYSQSNRDTNSYIMLIRGNATLNEKRLEIEEKKLLGSGDKVRVIGDSSLAVIEWGDGSLTRLGGNTKISVEQNEVSRDFTDINISFDLIAGKTWSHVVSFIGKDSSFTQTFNGIEAGVRGTVFDVDLEKQFIHVSDHAVSLTGQEGNSIIVPEGSVLSTQNFSFIELSTYIATLRDNAWNDLNKNFDNEYIVTLRENLQDSIGSGNPFFFIMRWISPSSAFLYTLDTSDDYMQVSSYISAMTQSEKQKVYTKTLSRYQEMNFVSPDNLEKYSRKIRYKKALIDLGVSEENSENLLRSSLYDLQDIFTSENTSAASQTLPLLTDNKELLQNIDISVLGTGFNGVPDSLKKEFKESFNMLGDIFNIDISSLKGINSQTIGNTLDGVDGVIQNFLDENVGGLLENLSK